MTERRRTCRRLALLIALLALPAVPALAQKGLAGRLDAKLDAPPFHRHLWGAAVVDERGRLLYGRNAERLFIPASNTKLVVAAVAAVLLPPDWTVKTSVWATGPLVDGVVLGDLVLYGRGDPTFSRRCYATDTTLAGTCDADPLLRLRQLADSLRARGVRSVSGDLVGDGSYFETTLVHPGWESYDLNWWYAAPVSGLGVNDNSLDVTYAPGEAVGAPARVSFVPDFGDVVLENRTTTAPAGSRDRFDMGREPGTLRVWAEGAVPLGASPRTQYFALPDPNRFTAQAFRHALAEAGIAVAGGTSSTTDSLRYVHLRLTPPLAEVASRPLKDWIFPILNTSQNWFAEMLLKQLGRRLGGAGSWREGLAVERRFLIDSVGIDSTQISLSDGSGLSSTNVVSPLAFTRLLQYVRRHPRYPTFAAGLPLAGQPGSLRNRFVGTPLAQRVRAKTGSISRVNTLAGYVERADGRVYAFAIQANNHDRGGRAMIQQIDSVVVELAR